MTYENKFLNKAKAKFPNLDYSKVKYTQAKDKVCIICPKHGEFFQSPDLHMRGRGCPLCANKIGGDVMREKRKNGEYKPMPLKYSKEEMMALLKEKYPYFEFDLANYIGLTKGNVRLICPEHGVTESLPNNILKSSCGCMRCSIEKSAASKLISVEDIKKRFMEVHNNKFTYNFDGYKGVGSKVSIFCPEHGEFKLKATKHLSGMGCFQCRVDYNNLMGVYKGTYNEGTFRNKPELRELDATLYYIKIGKYYKIGITIDMGHRMSSLKYKFKEEIEVIHTVNGKLYDMYVIEQFILNEFKDVRIYRKTSTELFSENIISDLEAYTYQMSTRDTLGLAMKATYIEVEDQPLEIFKDPATDDGTKKSAKGLLRVDLEDGEYVLREQVTLEEAQSGELKRVFIDGFLENETSLREIRARLSV